MSVCVGSRCYETVERDNMTYYVQMFRYDIDKLSNEELSQVSDYVFENVYRTKCCGARLRKNNT